MRIALAQINPTVGDIAGNSRKIIEFAERAKSKGATTVVFPELCVIGYPPKDLVLKPQFIDDNLRAVQMIADRVTGIDVVIGYAAKNPAGVGKPQFNAVAVLRDGKTVSVHHKTLLPTYDVFDESRYFEPGVASKTGNLVRIGDQTVGLSVCEDLWNDERLIERRLYKRNPIADLNAAGAEILFNISASPFVVNKPQFRVELFGAQAKRYGTPLIVVNQVGGNDELVFDGSSAAFDASGNLIAQAKNFEEDLITVDVGASPTQSKSERARGRGDHATDLESIYKALLLGIHDYVRKCGFK